MTNLQALVSEWQRIAKEQAGMKETVAPRSYHLGASDAFARCADDLEKALARPDAPEMDAGSGFYYCQCAWCNAMFTSRDKRAVNCGRDNYHRDMSHPPRTGEG